MCTQQGLPFPKLEGVASNVHILPVLLRSMPAQKSLLLEGGEEFDFLSAVLFPRLDQEEVLPPCEKGEECFRGGCDMCNGQRSTLAQILRPEFPTIDPQGHFDLAA